jgi:hypothetical protein
MVEVMSDRLRLFGSHSRPCRGWMADYAGPVVFRRDATPALCGVLS